MGSIAVGNQDIGLGDDGFAMDRCQWDDSVAQKLRDCLSLQISFPQASMGKDIVPIRYTGSYNDWFLF